MLDLFSVLCFSVSAVTVLIRGSRELPFHSKRTCIRPSSCVALSLDSHTAAASLDQRIVEHERQIQEQNATHDDQEVQHPFAAVHHPYDYKALSRQALNRAFCAMWTGGYEVLSPTGTDSRIHHH